MINWIKKRIAKQSLWANISDAIFLLFIIALIIPNTRTEVLGLGSRARTWVWPPQVETENVVTLTDADYNFFIKDMEGNSMPFSDLKNKVVFLNLWATWCPPCVGEMPDIQKLYNKMKNNDNVAIVLLSNESSESVKAFIEKRGFEMPIYTAQQALPKAFSSTSIPVTFIISRKGEILLNQKGAANWSGKKTTELLEKLSYE